MEIWKEIKGYEGKYQVSNRGRVKSLARYKKGKSGEDRWYKEKILSAGMRGYYLSVVLYIDGDSKTQNVHRLVAMAFCENPNGYEYVNHGDGDKLNNNDWNLKWVSASQNSQHRYDVLGQISGNTGKLGIASNIVRHIYRQYDLDGNEIANYYGVCEASRAIGTHQSGKGIIRAIKRNGTYKGFRWDRINKPL